MLEKREMLYEGKAKKVFKTNDPTKYIVSYKDDATAFNGQKKGTIVGKGVVNNIMSNIIMQYLAKYGIQTHYVEQLNDRETVVERVDIVPLEVIVRNIAAGSFSKRYGVKEGTLLKQPTIEFSYKCDELDDPLINDSHILALGLSNETDLKFIKETTLKINELMKEFWASENITLVDFKLEFGIGENGEVLLADEISPDTCRFWEAGTWSTEGHVSLDKDRFRRDLADPEGAYTEMLKRLKEHK